MRTKPAIRFVALVMLAVGGPCILPGCAATDGCCENDGIPRANCLVCKKNGDLACVCVKVSDRTPRCEFGGATYYFCSEDCKRDFLKDPARYLPKTP